VTDTLRLHLNIIFVAVSGFVHKGGNDTQARAKKIATARRNSSIILESQAVVEFAAVSAVVRHSVTFMNKIGNEDKRGFLMKQSKFLGRWKKRYVVLSESTLEYFDRPQDAATPGNGKVGCDALAWLTYL